MSVLDTGLHAWQSVMSKLYSAVDPVDGFDYKLFVIATSWIVTGFETHLVRRQVPMYDRTKPPAELAPHMDDETFRKSQAYGRDKIRYSLFKTIFDQVLNWGMIKMGAFPWAWDLAGDALWLFGLSVERTITRSIVWVVILTVLSALPGIPWSLYYTFVVEEKHGFNKQTQELFWMDLLKSWGIGFVVGVPILAGFLKVIELGGDNFVPYLMAFLVFMQLSLQIIYPTFIQPLFNKLTPLPAGDLRNRVEALAGTLGFPLKHLYVIDGSKRSSHSNAYFYGLPWSKHIVIYDTLIEKSKPEEVEAVLGHELGHWYYSHPTKLLLIAQSHLLFTLTLFKLFINNKALFASFGFDPALAVSGPNGSPQPIVIGFMLFQLVSGPLDSIVSFFMHAQTRKYEYQADEFAIQLGKKAELSQSLINLHIDNLSSPHNDWLYSMYHHSHPTLPERLRHMDEYVPRAPLKLKDGSKILQGKKDL